MLDSDEIKRRFARALKANPGIQLKMIADACDVTPQAVGDWKRTDRIDKRHFHTLSELTHTGLSYWLDERGDLSDARRVLGGSVTSPEQSELHLIVALMAQALAASTPVAGRDLVAAIRDRIDVCAGTLAGNVVTALESQLADLADTFPRKRSGRESR